MLFRVDENRNTNLSSSLGYFFFFQAEDGIRDLTVTGVQTCALPISYRRPAQFGLLRALGGDKSVEGDRGDCQADEPPGTERDDRGRPRRQRRKRFRDRKSVV